TLQELKAFDPEVNVIMITALHEEDLALETMADGAFDYITKPVNPEYLEMALMT
ncbi:MAG: response regulator, partial [bacterium]